MKWILAGLGIIVAGAVAYATVSKLSADAIGMALGMTLGVLAGVPTAALVLLARRRDATDESDDAYRPIYVSVLPVAQTPELTSDQRRLCPPYRVETMSDGTTVLRWASPVEGVVICAGKVVEYRLVTCTTPIDEAVARGGRCVVLASEWDALPFHRRNRL